MANDNFKEVVDQAEKLNLATEMWGKRIKRQDSTLKNRVEILNDIVASQGDSVKLAEVQETLDAKIQGHIQKGQKRLATRYELEKKILNLAKEEAAVREKVNGALVEAGDTLLDGMITKAIVFRDTLKESGGALILAISAAVGLMVALQSQVDQVGQEFGAIGVNEFGFELTKAKAIALSLGYSFEDVASSVNALSNDFGIAVGDAIEISKSSMDTAKALGITTSEAATLTGMLMTMAGHSAESAQNFLKQGAALAKSAGVSPAAVMNDIASSSEDVALFTKDSGENIFQATVKARKMGVAFSDVASSAKGMLDFSESISKEMEASVLLGKQLNFQRARELALAGDLQGYQDEVLKQLNQIGNFNDLNLVQKDALAAATGFEVTALQKLVDESKNLTTEQEKMGMLSIEEIASEEAMANLTFLVNNMKALMVYVLAGIGYLTSFGGLIDGGAPIWAKALSAVAGILLGIWVFGKLASVAMKVLAHSMKGLSKGLASIAATGTIATPVLAMLAIIGLVVVGILYMIPPIIDSIAAAIVSMSEVGFLGLMGLAVAFVSLSAALLGLAVAGLLAAPALAVVAGFAAVGGAVGGWLFGGDDDSSEMQEVKEELKQIREALGALVTGFGGVPTSAGSYLNNLSNKNGKEFAKAVKGI